MEYLAHEVLLSCMIALVPFNTTHPGQSGRWAAGGNPVVEQLAPARVVQGNTRAENASSSPAVAPYAGSRAAGTSRQDEGTRSDRPLDVVHEPSSKMMDVSVGSEKGQRLRGQEGPASSRNTKGVSPRGRDMCGNRPWHVPVFFCGR